MAGPPAGGGGRSDTILETILGSLGSALGSGARGLGNAAVNLEASPPGQYLFQSPVTDTAVTGVEEYLNLLEGGEGDRGAVRGAIRAGGEYARENALNYLIPGGNRPENKSFGDAMPEMAPWQGAVADMALGSLDLVPARMGAQALGKLAGTGKESFEDMVRKVLTAPEAVGTPRDRPIGPRRAAMHEILNSHADTGERALRAGPEGPRMGRAAPVASGSVQDIPRDSLHTIIQTADDDLASALRASHMTEDVLSRYEKTVRRVTDRMLATPDQGERFDLSGDLIYSLEELGLDPRVADSLGNEVYRRVTRSMRAAESDPIRRLLGAAGEGMGLGRAPNSLPALRTPDLEDILRSYGDEELLSSFSTGRKTREALQKAMGRRPAQDPNAVRSEGSLGLFDGMTDDEAQVAFTTIANAGRNAGRVGPMVEAGQLDEVLRALEGGSSGDTLDAENASALARALRGVSEITSEDGVPLSVVEDAARSAGVDPLELYGYTDSRGAPILTPASEGVPSDAMNDIRGMQTRAGRRFMESEGLDSMMDSDLQSGDELLRRLEEGPTIPDEAVAEAFRGLPRDEQVRRFKSLDPEVRRTLIEELGDDFEPPTAFEMRQIDRPPSAFGGMLTKSSADDDRMLWGSERREDALREAEEILEANDLYNLADENGDGPLDTIRGINEGDDILRQLDEPSQDLVDNPPPRLKAILDSDRYDVREVEPGRFEYTLRGTEGWDEAVPTMITPDGEIQNTRRASRYNPEIATARAVTDEYGTRYQYDLKPGWVESLPDEGDPDLMYRGMSWEEWQEAQRTGILKSLGEYNIGEEQQGLTYYTTEPRSAQQYASSFAPVQFEAAPDRPAVVIAVPRRQGRHVEGTGEHEIGIPDEVPLAEVQGVWEGHPYEVTGVGHSDILDDWGGRRDGSAAPQSRSIAWRESAPDDAARQADPNSDR